MKTSRIVILALALCLLASIGVNSILYRHVLRCYRELQSVRLDPAGMPPSGASAAVDRDKARVVLLGDSRIAQWNPMPDLEGCQVLNCGIAGETSAQTALRLDRDIAKLDPSIVVIQVGINDLKAIGVFEGRKDRITARCYENLQGVIDSLSHDGIHVIVLTVFPPGPASLWRKPVWSDEIYDAVSRLNDRLRGIKGPTVTVVDCDPVLAQGTRIKPQYARDTLHLNDKGYRALNSLLIPVLTKLVTADSSSSPADAIQ